MKVFEGVTKEQANARFDWLRKITDDEKYFEPWGDEVWKFIKVYADFPGDIYDSMQAALDTNTPYAQDLALRLMAEVLQGKVP